jgi:hypothetical protein
MINNVPKFGARTDPRLATCQNNLFVVIHGAGEPVVRTGDLLIVSTSVEEIL